MRHLIQTAMAAVLPAIAFSACANAAMAGGSRTGLSSDAAMVISLLVVLVVAILVRWSDLPFRPLPTAIVMGCLVNILIT